MQTQGRLTTPEQFGDDRPARQSGRLGAADRRRRAGRAGRAERGHREPRSTASRRWRSALYLAPGANAVQTAGARQRARSTELQRALPRGPEGAGRSTTRTVFVTDTISEVVRTLVDAFVLVVIVVFLFLGSLRATIIPTVAVPVSLIGTFAVLLLLGYSANTVSLLALVLAIGIVVDDAIVVVENVERVMEEEPDLSPHEATQEGDGADHRRRSSRSRLVLLSVFVPVAFIPGISGTAVPPVRGDDQRRDADLGDQRADPVAGAVRRVPAPSRPRRAGRWAGCCAASTGARRLRRHRAAGWCASRVLSVAGDRRLLGVGIFVPGAASRRPASCRRRTRARSSSSSSCPTAPRWRAPATAVRAGREPDPEADAAGRRTCSSIVGFSLLDGGNQPNAAFVVARLKPFEDRRGAANSAQALIGQMFGDGAADPHRQRRSRSTCRRSSACRPAAASNTSSRTWRGRTRREMGSVMQGLVAAANQDPRLSARVLDLHRDQPVDLSRHRPRQGAGARARHERRVQRAAGDAGRHVTSTTSTCYGRTWQVNIQGEAEDRRRHRRASGRSMCATSSGDDGAAALDRRRCASSLGPQVITPLQQLPLDHDQRQRRRRASPPATRWRRWRRFRPRRCRRATPSNGPAPPIQETQAQGQTGPILALAVLFAYPVPGRAVRELDDPDAGAAVGVGRRAGRLRRHPDRRAVARPLCADRPGRADRAGRQERHPDRRVRQGAARGRACRSARPRCWARACGSAR